MGAKQTVHAVDMVRQIRDELARQMAKRSADEVIAFYRQAGEHARRAAPMRTPPPPPRGRRTHG
jgi:hypothetical protein